MMIRDEINELLDALPDHELNVVYSQIELVHRKYMYNKNLEDKGVLVTELCEESEEIIQKWDNTFAKNIGEEVKEAIYYSQYKWHMFSYVKQDCLTDNSARDAFNAENKNELYVMYQHTPFIQVFQNANNVIAEDFDSEQDIYIFDQEFTWTYVHTHESRCGPYFYKVK
ncbi:DUF4275 family protein [Paenibacillus sp. OK003]|uniref:DUF4275 family protein n=1 Tax=Paenibacillus sp. OK003 TaxID=1884380 RepID=UPI0020C86AC5|nr:DUF4275 family protein [Paenibacillus sp. OK003]